MSYTYLYIISLNDTIFQNGKAPVASPAAQASTAQAASTPILAGPTSATTAPATDIIDVETQKLKKRAERFGIPVVENPLTKANAPKGAAGAGKKAAVDAEIEAVRLSFYAYLFSYF
jgi:hypothetical protein